MLEAGVPDTRAETEVPAAPARVPHPARFALLFPGQGSQRPGMAARLLEISRAARAVFEEADRALDFSLSRLCVEGDAEELSDTENTQPALLATSVAYFEYLKERMGDARHEAHALRLRRPQPGAVQRRRRL